jgi:hypothetical protein
MVRIILRFVLLACLMAPGAQAQMTADQLNKLSLESLTAPPSRGGGGYRPTPHRAERVLGRRPAYTPRSNDRRGYGRSRPTAGRRSPYHYAPSRYHRAPNRASGHTQRPPATRGRRPAVPHTRSVHRR